MHAQNYLYSNLGIPLLCRFFLNIQLPITKYSKTQYMVITTHMYSQMIKENQNKEILENPDSDVIRSFLKDSESLGNTEEVISSNS